MAKARVPVIEGLFTMDEEPHLIGGRGKAQESYFFPKDLAGRDPACINLNDEAAEFEEVLLSRTGTVWSYTNAGYPPPLPYIIDPQDKKEAWEPFVLAAVKLEKENLVVLGQMVEGTQLEDMGIGMQVELVLDVLYEDDENEYLMWKWRAR